MNGNWLCVLGAFAAVWGAVLPAQCQQPPTPRAAEQRTGSPQATELVGPNIDWRAQDFPDSRGVLSVQYDTKVKRLVLDCLFKTDDCSKGEIVLDLKYLPGLEAGVPVNFSGRTVTVVADVPPAFVGPRHAANGCQVFCQDQMFRGEYGTWRNCFTSGQAMVALAPSTRAPSGGHVAPGFDPTKTRTIGIKFALNDRAIRGFRGQIYINSIRVSPPLSVAAPVQLPVGEPWPLIKAESKFVARPDGFYVDGKKTFIVGGNWRILGYADFGRTKWFPNGNGVSRHPGYVAASLQKFHQAGITLVRVGLLDDGRTMFDPAGKRVIGYDDVFRNDVRTLLTLASRSKVKIEWVLVDYLIAGKAKEEDGVGIRGRWAVIEDPRARANFAADFLEPFLKEFGRHPATFGYDIINEPEWIVGAADGGAWEDVKDLDTKASSPVSGRAFREFVATCTERIRRHCPDKPITVGVSCAHLGLVSDLELDYRAPHYYPWMGQLDSNLAKLGKGKPWMLEEFPGKGDVTLYLRKTAAAGGAGALMWNLTPETDPKDPEENNHCYTFAQEAAKLQEIRRFVDSIQGANTLWAAPPR
jgi:hypothetical protein